jgi:hypothetical protein
LIRIVSKHDFFVHVQIHSNLQGTIIKSWQMKSRSKKFFKEISAK